MTEEKPDYILRPGQPSLEKTYGEKTKRVNFSVPKSMYDYLMDREARGLPAAEYLRRLIAADIATGE